MLIRSVLSLLLLLPYIVQAEPSTAASAAASSSLQPATAVSDVVPDPTKLQLASVNALVMDMDSQEILFERNPTAVVPIASITKLMTAMVVLDDLAHAPLDEWIAVDVSQTEVMSNVFSHLRIGSKLRRQDMLLLALMSSENRAAATLAHHYSGGYPAFVRAMNTKAEALGMEGSHFVEPTGLSPNNVSTPKDLAKLLIASTKQPLIAELSTTQKKDFFFRSPRYVRAYYNTNPLVLSQNWNIDTSKTGFINEAGRCLLLSTEIKDRHLAIVLLDSFGKRSHIGDAGRVRRWLETGRGGKVHPSALEYVKRKQHVLMASETLN